MYNYVGREYLRNQLGRKKIRVGQRYSFYEMKNSFPDLGISMPGELRKLKAVSGWSAKAVDNFADRLTFRKFKNDPFDLDGVIDTGTCRDIFFNDSILSASIGSCAFAYLSKDADGQLQIQVIDGANATGIMNPITRMLYEGYAVLDVNPKTKKPTLEAYFCPDYTEYYDSRGKEFDTWKEPNPTGYPLLVPIVLKPDAVRPFGHSRISRALMYYQSAACRTMMRSEVSAEFYSFPQKYVTGLPQDVDMDSKMVKWQSAMSAMLAFYTDENGNDTVKLGQFQQQSMSPYVEQLKMFASLAASEAGLTLDDMGFPTANPSSDDAIRSQHENLERACLKAQDYFSVAFKNVAFVGRCLLDGTHLKRSKELSNVKCIWKPSFVPSASSLAGIGDGIAKINESISGYINSDGMYELTGIEGGEE